MVSPAAGVARHARAFLVAVVMLTLSSAGHLAGGGRMPHPVALTLLLGAACVPAYLLARRRLGLVTLIGLLGAGQYTVHVVLTSQPSMHDHGSGSMHDHGGTQGGLVMVAAHVAATVMAAGVLAHADSLLWVLWGLLTSALRFVFPVVSPAVPGSGSMLALTAETPLITHLGDRDADPRGPPVDLCPIAG